MVGCPSCGAELTLIGEYERHYCKACRSYAPRTLLPCGSCGRALVFVREHQGFYCYGCEEYKANVPVEKPCPTCGEELEYVPTHDRHYCPACEEYAPRGPGPAGRQEGGPAVSAGEDGVIGYATFSREEMDLASKEQLMEWCREYDLDDSGLKYELRLRLLEHIRRNNLLLKGEIPPTEDAEEEEPEAPPPAPRPEEPAVVVEEEASPPEPDVGTLLEGVGAPERGYETPPGEAYCPTCGQPLTYVAEYDQWYCYHCQSYTREPASADDRPEVAQGRPAGTRRGLALAGAGLAMYLVDQLFFHAPPFLPVPLALPPFLMTPEIDWGLGVFSIVFIAAGLMAAARRR